MDLINSKKFFRSHFLQKREAIGSVRREDAQSGIFSFFSSFSGTIVSFASLIHEVDLWPLNEKLAEEKRLVLPRICGDELELYFVDSLKEQLEISPWKILEPIPSKCRKVSLDEIQTILVPGLAFDENHMRLGFGKGFYDRLLEKCQAKKYGVGFKEQLSISPLPCEVHDQMLDEIYLF